MPELESSTGGAARFHLGPHQLLPLSCALCGQTGIVPVPLEDELGRPSHLRAHLCESCAEGYRDEETVRFAARLAALIIGLGVAATAALVGEESAVWLQAAGVTGFALLGQVVALTTAERHHAARPRVRVDPKTGGALVIFPTANAPPGWNEALASARGEPLPLAMSRQWPRSAWLLGLAPLVLWAALQTAGRASIHLAVSGEGATLLVDHRVAARLPGLVEEHPDAGAHLSLMSGRRLLEVVSEGGETVLQGELTLLPFHHYLLGKPPSGSCFFLEQMSSGSRPVRRKQLPAGELLSDLGPRLDLFFAPAPESEPHETRGGTLRALRLLPCRKGSP